jgi:metaxin
MTEPNPPPTHTASDTLKTASARLNSLFSIPAPIKAVFDAVPVVVYGANDLPGVRPVKQQQQGRKNGEKEKAKLYVFCREEDVENGGPSFNPGCLRWQVSC